MTLFRLNRKLSSLFSCLCTLLISLLSLSKVRSGQQKLPGLTCLISGKSLRVLNGTIFSRIPTFMMLLGRYDIFMSFCLLSSILKSSQTLMLVAEHSNFL